LRAFPGYDKYIGGEPQSKHHNRRADNEPKSAAVHCQLLDVGMELTLKERRPGACDAIDQKNADFERGSALSTGSNVICSNRRRISEKSTAQSMRLDL
jgi:hypothetical protein